jgi:hypothetical protein
MGSLKNIFDRRKCRGIKGLPIDTTYTPLLPFYTIRVGKKLEARERKKEVK